MRSTMRAELPAAAPNVGQPLPMTTYLHGCPWRKQLDNLIVCSHQGSWSHGRHAVQQPLHQQSDFGWCALVNVRLFSAVAGAAALPGALTLSPAAALTAVAASAETQDDENDAAAQDADRE